MTDARCNEWFGKLLASGVATTDRLETLPPNERDAALVDLRTIQREISLALDTFTDEEIARGFAKRD